MRRFFFATLPAALAVLLVASTLVFDRRDFK